MDVPDRRRRHDRGPLELDVERGGGRDRARGAPADARVAARAILEPARSYGRSTRRMSSMAEDHLPSPPAPTIEVCYRHPDVPTRVHCTRCERPICPDCMIPAPVGFQCPECVADARREFRKGPGRPLRGGVSVTKALLVAIAIPFVIEVVLGGPQALYNPSTKLLF